MSQFRKWKIPLSFAMLFGCVSTPYAAESLPVKPYQFPTTNVTAARYKLPIDQVGNVVHVSDQELWQKVGVLNVPQALSLMPGIAMTNASGITGIFIRGLPAQNSRVMFDGITLLDPTSTQGTWSFDLIDINQLERIEVVEGAKSALYGSNAQISTIQLIPTRRNYLDIRGGVGQFGVGVGFKQSIQDTDLYVNVTQRTEALQSQIKGSSEIDRVENGNYHISVSQKLGLGSAKFIYHKNRNLAGLDESYAPDVPFSTLDNPNYLATSEQDLTKVSLDIPLSETFKSTMSYQRSSLSRVTQGSLYSYNNVTSIGYSDQFEWVQESKINSNWDLLTGIDLYQEENIYQTQNNKNSRFGYYLQNVWQLPRGYFQAGFRQETYLGDKKADSYNLGLTLPIYELKSTFKTNMSQGFRAPTLFERTGVNPPQLPEISFTKDLSWEFRPFPGFKTAVTAFESLIDQEILYKSLGFPNFRYENSTAIRRTTGMSYQVECTDIAGLDFFSISYLNQLATKSDGSVPVRIPNEQISLAVGSHLDQWEWGATALYVGKRHDIVFNQNDFETFTPELSHYYVVSTRLSYHIDSRAQIYATVQNAFNRNYELVTGYSTPQRNIQFGYRVDL
jgi:vitamin B12 transporter